MPVSDAGLPKMIDARAARTDPTSLRITTPATPGTLRAHEFAVDRGAAHGSVASGFGKPSTAEHVTGGPVSGSSTPPPPSGNETTRSR